MLVCVCVCEDHMLAVLLTLDSSISAHRSVVMLKGELRPHTSQLHSSKPNFCILALIHHSQTDVLYASGPG